MTVNFALITLFCSVIYCEDENSGGYDVVQGQCLLIQLGTLFPKHV
jgi:hypothetical protein